MQSKSTTGLDELIQEYTKKIEYFDALEQEATQAKEYYKIIEGVAPVYRAIGHLHQVLQEARTACPKDRELIKMRDQAYAMERTAELFYKGARNALDFLVALRAEQQQEDSQSMSIAAHRLNILAAFFFPLSISSSLFGGSYKDVLDGSFPGWSFAILLVTSLLCGVFLTKLLSQKQPLRRESL